MSDVKEKDIPGFEGIYKVTENGDIISCRKSKKLSHGIKPGGYAFVGLYPGGGKRPSYKMVHRIVAEVFIDNPDGKPESNPCFAFSVRVTHSRFSTLLLSLFPSL